MDSQLADGYIGNYRADRRAQGGWDVWGVKYTLMGLLYYHDLTHEERPLACARRLADWLIGEVGPGGKRRIVTTGNYCGMPSCSVLEPIVWLYRVRGSSGRRWRACPSRSAASGRVRGGTAARTTR